MNIKEYLKELNSTQQVTFVTVKAVKDDYSPFYHNEFYQTPIRNVWEWLDGTWSNDPDYIVVKKDTMPIDITGVWDRWYKSGSLKCCMVMKKSELIKQYGEKQGNDMIKFYEREVSKKD